MNQNYESWQCPQCGESIGWLGRFFMWIFPWWHRCNQDIDEVEEK